MQLGSSRSRPTRQAMLMWERPSPEAWQLRGHPPSHLQPPTSTHQLSAPPGHPMFHTAPLTSTSAPLRPARPGHPLTPRPPTCRPSVSPSVWRGMREGGEGSGRREWRRWVWECEWVGGWWGGVSRGEVRRKVPATLHSVAPTVAAPGGPIGRRTLGIPPLWLPRDRRDRDGKVMTKAKLWGGETKAEPVGVETKAEPSGSGRGQLCDT